jgi:hypothetical protein
MGDINMGQAQQVTRRRVFYIPGYDPIHPRRYRELYRSESRDQAAISGYEIALKARQSAGPYSWHVDAKIDGQGVDTVVEVLVWSDIVRASMENSIAATYGQLCRTAWTYISTGALRRLMWLRKGPVLAALYPVGALLLQLFIATLLAAFIYRTTVYGAMFAPHWLGFPLRVAGFVAALIIGWAVLDWFRRHDGKFYVYYLMHDFSFSARWNGANPAPLETRMEEFKSHIAKALRDDIDEVLVVGHSSGAHLAVSILADMEREGLIPAQGPELAFLSLGQVVPMMSFLPEAKRLRRDLNALSLQGNITWVDVTAPGDGCAFALCDPVTVSGVATAGKKWPLVISAAFTQTLSPTRWKQLRWRFFRLHFQYLCAFDRPGDYDYFHITAGPLTLKTRYQNRAPSKSRIDVAASPYTTVL